MIPKSIHKERMIQNFEVFDFALSDEDMEAICKPDEGESLIACFSRANKNYFSGALRIISKGNTEIADGVDQDSIVCVSENAGEQGRD